MLKSTIWMRPQSCSQEPIHCFWYLGKLRSVGTWQVRWNTFGHFSQHNRSPPFWHTAHQSSFGSSSLLLPSPPILADRCIRLRTGDFPFRRLCPDCLQLSLKSPGSVFTWFSKLPNASNSLSRCKLVDSGGVKLLSGLLSWNESSTWKSKSQFNKEIFLLILQAKHQSPFKKYYMHFPEQVANHSEEQSCIQYWKLIFLKSILSKTRLIPTKIWHNRLSILTYQ